MATHTEIPGAARRDAREADAEAAGARQRERRRQRRTRRRIPCTLEGIRPWAGLTVDLAEGGLFVRTGAPVEPGTEVRLLLHSGVVEIPLRGLVVRRRTPPPALGRLAAGGVAIRLDAPPPGYLALVRAGL